VRHILSNLLIGLLYYLACDQGVMRFTIGL